MLLFVFGMIAAIVGVIALFVSMEEESFGIFLFSIFIFMGAVAILCFHFDGPSSDDQKKQDTTTVNAADNTSDNAEAAVVDDAKKDGATDNTSDEVNAADDNSSDSQGDDKKDDSKKFDWQKWADDIVKKNQLISCTPEGIQVYVSGTQDTDDADAGPGALAVWPRLHQDGKPFLCSEGKDPKEEPKR